MQDDVRAKLQTLLARADRDELLDDPRRLAELVRERLGAGFKREASFLNLVMQEGAPKRLLAMSNSSLSGSALANYAKRISDDTGLKEDIALSAIETWATCLGLPVAPTRPPPVPPPPLPRQQPEIGPPAAGPRGGMSAGSERTSLNPAITRALAIAIVVVGAAVLLLSALLPGPFFEEYVIWRQALPALVIGASSFALGLEMILACGDPADGSGDDSAAASLRRAAMAVCIVDAVLGAWLVMSMAYYAGVNLLVFALATIAHAAIVASLLLRPPALPNAPDWNRSHAIALLLVVCGLFGAWIFVGETMITVSLEFTVWLGLQVPAAIALFIIGVRMLIVRSRPVPSIIVLVASAWSTVVFAADFLWWMSVQSWEWNLLDLVGVFGNLAVAALVWHELRAPTIAGLGGPNAASAENRPHA
jgi:hypothetical protein